MMRAIHMFQFYPRCIQIIAFLLLSNLCWSQQVGDLSTSSRSLNSTVDSSGPRPGTTSVAANPKLKGNGFKKMMLGKNYRKEWTEPINVPALYLSAAHLKPTKEGGGKQTR